MTVLQFRGPITFCVLQWCHPMLTRTLWRTSCGTRMIALYGVRKRIQARAGERGGGWVGCLPSARWDTCLGVVCPSACWDTCWEVSAPMHAGIPARGRGVYPSTSWDTTPPLWTEFLTHACENITFPQLLLRTVIIGVDVITYCMRGCVLRGFSLIHWMTDLAFANFTNCFKTYLLMTALVLSVSVQKKKMIGKCFG